MVSSPGLGHEYIQILADYSHNLCATSAAVYIVGRSLVDKRVERVCSWVRVTFVLWWHAKYLPALWTVVSRDETSGWAPAQASSASAFGVYRHHCATRPENKRNKLV